MARANRLFIPGYIWHITHRCHKREFLFKFVRDRALWMELLFEARRRFRIAVLNYIVTSNHIHLIVSDNGVRDAIPRSMQLIAGRIGQEYNRRKGRKGAFWEDRYHATAIESDSHLWKCMVYVDLNMVRAGVVDHPSAWKWSGYHEIQKPKQRYRIIDHQMLKTLLHLKTDEELSKTHQRWIEGKLKINPMERQKRWSQSLAVGTQGFVERIKDQLGRRAQGRVVSTVGSDCQLKETVTPFSRVSEEPIVENSKSTKNTNSIDWQLEKEYPMILG